MSEKLCGRRERQYDENGRFRFFCSSYPCNKPRGHDGRHRGRDGAWDDSDSEPYDGWNDEQHRKAYESPEVKAARAVFRKRFGEDP